MEYPKIIYWKWDDSHVELGNYREKIDDIVQRSNFDHIYITTHWCHEGITSNTMHDVIKDACHYIHCKGRKLIFEIDPRAEKSVFVKKYPHRKIAFVYTKEIILNNSGEGNSDFYVVQGSGGELFLGNRQSGESLLRVYCFKKIRENSYDKDSLQDITEKCILERTSQECVRIEVKSGVENSQKTAFVMAAVWYDFNDLFSEENTSFFDELLQQYSDIPLDGIALDEMGFPWLPNFSFSHASYIDWNNTPYYSYEMEREFEIRYNKDLLLNYFHMRYYPQEDDFEQIASINIYNEFIRNKVTEVESYFYNRVKEIYGPNMFVGVHPTWFAIEEVDNTAEIWKNGIDWWDVPRDYGFTDEIMIYPVRLALTHKWGSNIFYNMWYSESTARVETFFEETWKNARFGGRTITLGYECSNEQGIVIELKYPGLLEKVSQMEEKINLLNQFQTAPAASDIIIIMGIPASSNVLCNLNACRRWDHYKGVFTECFSLARDIWNAGYNCDLVGSYEVEDGDVKVLEDGRVQYGNQVYNSVLLAFPEFSKEEVLHFAEKIISKGSKLSVIGNMTRNFYGKVVKDRFEGIKQNVDYYAVRPQVFDLINQFHTQGIQTYRVPYGCILQDGSVILTAPAPDRPIGNKLSIDFMHQSFHVEGEGTDLFALKLDEGGHLEKLCAVNLKYLKINGESILEFGTPQDILWSKKEGQGM